MMRSTLSLLQKCRLPNNNGSLLSFKNNQVVNQTALFSMKSNQQYRFYSTDVKDLAPLIKELRNRTSAPLKDCKEALIQNKNDIEKATSWLHEKGKSTANKFADRAVVEGTISIVVNNGKAVILEMNSETDFVSRGETFRALADQISRATLESNLLAQSLAEIKPDTIAPQPASGSTVADLIVGTVAKLRENIRLRRVHAIDASNQPNTIVAGYAHDPSGTNQFGRLGSLVQLQYEGGQPDIAALNQLARNIAVHIVGVGPSYVSIESVPKVLLDEAIANKRHPNSLYDEVVLLEQKYISGEDNETVKAAVQRISKQLKTNITIKSFVRYSVGEGMEKKVENYGAEVMEKINKAK
ncbi:elongation factor Ts [Heterostelium album PN500]|uniref:Elongation factor Ts, mitochondrial n=1 Tax=Heterostelium pallidum (strain ATCC 26659 / Pp 5 / PN500) TaxID=670386 RepID=EFTS_HETP5|nr:elongation factor Ts [Heterostelium album PN500]D3BAV8.1 RecName: Full=Elongation factor Ts, mitochondrial; Short=EF-Ts; Short=EF-TsMt; Flags: Precursor [Heterostelium album PN500]EFA81695.1 elongation factor Ts [Heterostelium album PN500]|eukprot:XP_020433812.1 elongation factor Ts [Heterostelium album PN500]